MNYKQLFANEIRVPPPSYLLEGVALGGGDLLGSPSTLEDVDPQPPKKKLVI